MTPTFVAQVFLIGGFLLIAGLIASGIVDCCATKSQTARAPRVENKIVRYTASPGNPVTAAQMVDEISANLATDGNRKINAADIQITLIDLVAFIEQNKK